jgi:hypothetical protein
MNTDGFQDFYGLDNGFGGTNFEKAGKMVDGIIASNGLVISVGVNGPGDGNGNIIPGKEFYVFYVDPISGGNPGGFGLDYLLNPVVDFTIGGLNYQLGRALDKRLAYDFTRPSHEGWLRAPAKVPPTSFKVPGGRNNVPTSIVNGAANTLKVGGAALGMVGVGMTGYEIYTGEKNLIGEGGLDLVMGGIAFIPGGGWIVSGAYFGGKALLRYTGNDFWNKP